MPRWIWFPAARTWIVSVTVTYPSAPTATSLWYARMRSSWALAAPALGTRTARHASAVAAARIYAISTFGAARSVAVSTWKKSAWRNPNRRATALLGNASTRML